MTARTLYHCAATVDAFRQVWRGLARTKFLTTGASPYVVNSYLTRCEPCLQQLGASQCRGWRVLIPRDNPLVSGPLVFRKHTVQVEIAVRIDCTRSQHAPDEVWQLQPVRSSDLEVCVYDLAGSAKRLVRRDHIDLATPGQPGPVWHQQPGGNAAGGTVTDSWLDIPRWPIYPYDPLLFIDTVVYNFARDKWIKMNTVRPYQLTIAQAETLMLTDWHRRLNEHLAKAPASRTKSWLARLDNQGSDDGLPEWDPRLP